MLKYSLLLICLIPFFVFDGFSQTQILDSLNQKLSDFDESESQYPQILNLICKHYTESNPDTALSIGFKLLDIIRKQSQDSLIGQTNIALATAYSYKAQYDSSLSFSFGALRIAQKYNDTITLMDAYNNLGIDFSYQNENKTAIEYFRKTEKIAEKYGDSLRWGHALNNIGMIHGFEEQTESELKYYAKAGLIFKRIGEKEGYANTLLNTGTVYTLLGDYQRAKEQYETALSIFKTLNLTSAIGETYINLSENYLKSNQLKTALDMAGHALSIAYQYNFEQDKIYIFDLLRKIHEQKGDFKQAYYFLDRYYSLKEEVFNSEKSLQINDLQTRYETAVKQSEIEKLTLENQLQVVTLTKAKWQIGYLVTAIVLIIGLTILFFWFRAKKQKTERTEHMLQLDALQNRYLSILNDPKSFNLEISKSELNQALVNHLTDREYETLKLSIKGNTNQEIADALFVSLSTVKFHMGNIYNKLGVSNKKEALAYVVKSS